MRFLILFLFSINAFAMDYYIVPDASDPTKKVIIGTKGFVPPNAISKAPIDPETGAVLKDAELIKDTLVEVNDIMKPIFRPPDESQVQIDCVDSDDCISKIKKNTCPKGEHAIYNEKGFFDSIFGDDWFIYCQKRLGFEKKQIMGFGVDIAKKEAKQIERLNKRNEMSNKKNARKNRIKRIRDACDGETGLLKDMCKEMTRK